MAASTSVKLLPIALVAALVAATLVATKGCDHDTGPAMAAQNTGKPADPPKKDAPAGGQPGTPDGKDDKPAQPAAPETMPITINGKTFKLELALEDKVRAKGLGQRTEIATDGGMLFGFRDAQRRGFVMRDCFVDIDIIYLDGAGRVLSWYTMKAEDPRKPDEGPVGDSEGSDPNSGKYERRLKQYPSKFPTQFVIELKGGTIPSLDLKEGQKIEADWAGLKKRAK